MFYLPYDSYDECEFSELIGKTVVKLVLDDERDAYDNHITFYCSDSTVYDLWHDQDCCEKVGIEEIVGDSSVLLSAPITMAEMVSNNNHDAEYWGEDECSTTWTFYKLATIHGYVTIRWLGESNGCYSEEVTFSKRK